MHTTSVQIHNVLKREHLPFTVRSESVLVGKICCIFHGKGNVCRRLSYVKSKGFQIFSFPLKSIQSYVYISAPPKIIEIIDIKLLRYLEKLQCRDDFKIQQSYTSKFHFHFNLKSSYN